MSRNAYLSSVISLPAKIIANRENKSSNSCDTYRSVEWSKYSTSYHNLLYSDPMSKTMQTKGFFDINGEKYKTEYKYNLNLSKVIKDSIVNRPKMIWLPCIDERIQYLTASHHALSLGMPGCECSMSDDEKLKMADELIAICDNNPTIEEIVVSSHSKCGAVATTLNNKRAQKPLVSLLDKFRDQDKLIDSTSEKYASNFAQIIEKRLEIKNSPVTVRTHHFHFQELHSKNLHHALGAIVNFNPLLNGAELEENLEIPMFNIYAGGQKSSQIMKNIDLAINIASGNNGFSCQYIDKNNPFILLFTIPKGDKSIANQIKKIIDKIQSQYYPIELVYTFVDTK
jgi:carbonic anhydrase